MESQKVGITHFESWCRWYQASLWLNGKESTCQCRRLRFDPWVGKIPGEGNDNPLPYSCLGNPMDRGAWRATVHGIAKSGTRLTDSTRRCYHLDQALKHSRRMRRAKVQSRAQITVKQISYPIYNFVFDNPEEHNKQLLSRRRLSILCIQGLMTTGICFRTNKLVSLGGIKKFYLLLIPTHKQIHYINISYNKSYTTL